MKRTTASELSRDPTYRRQNRHLAQVCSDLGLPLADTTEALVQAEQDGSRSTGGTTPIPGRPGTPRSAR